MTREEAVQICLDNIANMIDIGKIPLYANETKELFLLDAKKTFNPISDKRVIQLANYIINNPN